jgi:hypothetical protein
MHFLQEAGRTSCTSSLEELRESAKGNNPILPHVVFESGLQIDVEEAETAENPMQSLRFIISSGGAHSFWPLYYIL